MKKYLKRFFVLESIVFIMSISLIAQYNTSDTQNYNNIEILQDATLKESITRGSEVYTDFCMQCHLPDGKGTPKIFPPLAGSDWLVDKRKESIHSIKYGLSGPIKVNGTEYNSAMTSLGLEDEEIADVMNYIMNSWGNTQKKMVTVDEVAAIKK
ncbi:cytochrome c [Aquimarina sp. 2201CG5-10]|uniref:c-type cytochrome n=1 Tax=Aquimarina callyspongiae TaxID=3098150 RepID=UPI002AB43BB0|nr:cytochrome c [Aquimarina sp. 2201CG5-10]MDY8137629.1 cytochrome c [Aquimarina sp. 2201CG5-10]